MNQLCNIAVKGLAITIIPFLQIKKLQQSTLWGLLKDTER